MQMQSEQHALFKNICRKGFMQPNDVARDLRPVLADLLHAALPKNKKKT